VIVALRTGSLGDLAQVLIGGTLAGYATSVITLFTVGHALEQQGVGSRVANAFLILVMVIGVAAAIAVAVSVDSGPVGDLARTPTRSADLNRGIGRPDLNRRPPVPQAKG